ncbi:MAG: PAS domain S-box protein [Ignavibacteriaceae bacterium]|jgi:PAS domain S-box-containing protein
MNNKRLKLLILDNKKDNIAAIKSAITKSKLSFTIKMAGSKSLFNEFLKDFRPDLIISNYKLSGFTGLEALLIIKKSGCIIPFIFFTDPVDEKTAVKCLKIGASDYILKSEKSKLLQAMLSALKNKKNFLSEMLSTEEIKSSEERYHRFIACNNEGIFRIELLTPVPVSLDVDKQFSLTLQNSIVAECNDEAAKIIGFQKGKDIIGLKINTFTSHCGKEEFDKFKKFTLNGYRISNIVVSESGPKGIKYFLSNFIGIIEDSNLIGVWGMFRDITEIRKAENNLRNSEERIKLMFDNLMLGVFQMDIKGRIQFANQSFVKMLGYNTFDEILGAYINFADKNEKTIIIEQLKKNNFIREFETLWTLKNGNKINVKISANVVKDDAGKIIFFEGIAEDISFKKRFESALIESEERFITMADAAPVMIWIAAVDRHFFYFNKLWLLFTGSTLLNELGNKWMKNIYPDDLNPFLNKYVSSFDRRTEFEIVFRLKRHDGEYRWILTRGIPNKLPDGSFNGFIGTAIDITDRKIAENTLKESEELYKGVVQSIMEGLIITDISDKVLFANTRMKEITGYEISEMVGNYNYRLFFEPDQWKTILEKNKNRFAGLSDRFEIHMHRKNGEEFWALINGSPYKNSKGKIIGSIKTINDISKNKIAEKALKESEEKYRTVVQNVREVIFKTDNAGKLTFLNPYWYEITGHDLEKSIGRYLFDFVHTDDKKRAVNEFISIIYKRKDYCRFEIKIETSSGEYRWFLINAHITMDDKCNIIGTYGTLNDIHDRRLAEEELIKAKDRAEESDNLKSHFLAQISHEIRSPLNIILGYNSLIKERLENESSLNLNSEFNIIEASGRRLLRTIDLVLNMSMVQTGSFDIMKEEFDLKILIEDMLIEFQSVAETKKIKLSYNNLCRNNKVFADKYTLTQAFQNLLDNAVKFTEAGSIEVFSYENEESIFVDISDTGVGISREYLPRLFEPFSQEEEGYSRKFDGNGLGLALTKKYIDLNQGEISVLSGKGQGTTFTIKLDRNNAREG